ncbi:MAG TPA: histidine phosphatase family protein [Candidatus Saccharimonadales bacterium]|nr:histidine phosphatase family protein [Candidatus Saccharimonadales bacterium]
MVTIIFESHATTYDNEKKIASGHYDVELSKTGQAQAKALGARRAGEHFDAVFCSDLQRSYKTAELAFGDKFPVMKDARLRECDYGEYEHRPSAEIEAERSSRIHEPFPGGESYEERTALLKEFIDDLAKNYDGKRVLVIGHRATQYGLERWVNKRDLGDIVSEPWQWQPGWEYVLG